MTTAIRSTLDDGSAKLLHIPFSEYAEIDAISASALKGVGRTSPDHLRSYLAGEIEDDDTDDKRFGRAMHCRVLEADRYKLEFPTATRCSGIYGSGKRKGEQCESSGSHVLDDKWYCGTHRPDKAVSPADYITEDEAVRIEVLARKLKESPANRYLARGGYNEAVIVWERLGFKLKTRIDRLHVEPSLITVVDLKKCRVGRCTDELMRKECEERGYFIQAAFNVDAVREVYGDNTPVEWHIVFIEDNYPFGSNILKATDDDIADGVNEIVRQLRNYRDCQKSGQWYSYRRVIDEPHEGIRPLWLRKQLNRGT